MFSNFYSLVWLFEKKIYRLFTMLISVIVLWFFIPVSVSFGLDCIINTCFISQWCGMVYNKCFKTKSSWVLSYFFYTLLNILCFNLGHHNNRLKPNSFFLLLTRLCSIILFLLLYFEGDSGRPDVWLRQGECFIVSTGWWLFNHGRQIKRYFITLSVRWQGYSMCVFWCRDKVIDARCVYSCSLRQRTNSF